MRNRESWIVLTVAICHVMLACGEGRTTGDTSSVFYSQRDRSIRIDVSRTCDAVADRFRHGAARVDVRADSFPDLTSAGKRFGCVVHAEGTLGGVVTIPYLARALPDSLGPGWMRDSAMVADGPRGTAYAVTRGDVQCLFRINWTMRVRYDTKADPAPYTANVGCAATPGRGSAP